MKKILLFLLSVLLCASCTNKEEKYTYSTLVAKLKTYSDETLIRNEYNDGYYSEQGFFTNDGGVLTLYSNSSNSESESYVFIRLENATEVPNVFYCLYTFSHFSTSYQETASLYVDNDFTSSTKLSFHVYNGADYMKNSSIGLATSSINLLLVVFNYWLDDEFGFEMKDIGLFPNLL